MATGAKRSRRKGFGAIRVLPSGRFQARYQGPDLGHYKAPGTFGTRGAAEGYLAGVKRDIDLGVWKPAKAKAGDLTFGQYAARWLAAHNVAETTRALYQRTLDGHVLEALGGIPLASLTKETVAEWFGGLDRDHVNVRAKAYKLVAQICKAAVEAELLEVSPCQVKGGGKAVTKHHMDIATEGEVQVMYATMPGRLRLAVLLGSLCAMRSGEVRELRRKDVDLDARVFRVERGVRRIGSTYSVGPTKTATSKRAVPIPLHMVAVVQEHLNEFAAPGPEGLLFPSAPETNTHIAEQTFNTYWDKARRAAGRPGFRFHDLRHTALTWHQMHGATLRETMALGGHASATVAMRYQHAAKDRLTAIADTMPVIGLPADHKTSKAA